MKPFLAALTVALLSAAPAFAQQGNLQLTLGNGRVTLMADNVPVRTILQEWARRGQSEIVNADKVMGPPVTLRLIDVPEEQALDIVLRSVSGYLAAPRENPVPNASRFDRIMILASSRPTMAAPPPAAPQPPQAYPNFPMPPPVMEVEDDQQDTDPNDPKPAQLPSASDQPGPIEISPPDPDQEMQPGQPPMQQPQPQLPLTSPRPGLIAPQPQQPSVRRPGGDDQ